jgi:hypothetical protein
VCRLTCSRRAGRTMLARSSAKVSQLSGV